MKSINAFYVSIPCIGLLLWFLNSYYQTEVVLFYGFAETKETEINFNYGVTVSKIYVSPGQEVKKGMPLLDLRRTKPKEVLEEQGYKMNELRAEEQVWRSEKEGEVRLLEKEKALKLAAIDSDIAKLEEQKKFQQSLYDDLKSVAPSQSDYQPISDKVNSLKKERELVLQSFGAEIQTLKNGLRLGKNPYQIAIDRLEAERDFERANQVIDIQLTALEDGIIGNIHCKEAENIPAYRTLVTFYEPNPVLVKGYVHENLILEVAVQDSFRIRSTKDEAMVCYGVVTGLGSRIVEIPDRLRKVADMKTYGREVLVSIPADNQFLQKEKVILEFLKPVPAIQLAKKATSLVDLKEAK